VLSRLIPSSGRGACLVEHLRVARHSGWQARVNQDDKGSRGVPIMPLMVVAGKDQGSA
jgi:hypothetical protein